MNNIVQIIEGAWHSDMSSGLDAAKDTLKMLDEGTIKISEKVDGKWITYDWIRKAILIYMKCVKSSVIDKGFYDKIPLKFTNWNEKNFEETSIRVVPGAVVRYASHLDKECVIMPSFINFGVYVGKKTMIDTNVTLGSCCHIANNCHIGAGVVIGGVVEPLHDKPTIIEDNVFIGASCSITSGILICEGAVIAPGTHVSQSTRIYDCTQNKMTYGVIPSNAVVVPGTMPRDDKSVVNIACALIVKYVDKQTRNKVAINELLR